MLGPQKLCKIESSAKGAVVVIHEGLASPEIIPIVSIDLIPSAWLTFLKKAPCIVSVNDRLNVRCQVPESSTWPPPLGLVGQVPSVSTTSRPLEGFQSPPSNRMRRRKRINEQTSARELGIDLVLNNVFPHLVKLPVLRDT